MSRLIFIITFVFSCFIGFGQDCDIKPTLNLDWLSCHLNYPTYEISAESNNSKIAIYEIVDNSQELLHSFEGVADTFEFNTGSYLIEASLLADSNCTDIRSFYVPAYGAGHNQPSVCRGDNAKIEIYQCYDVYSSIIWDGPNGNGCSYTFYNMQSDTFVNATRVHKSGCISNFQYRALLIDDYSPVITGEKNICQGSYTLISTTEEYESYSWSNGLEASAISIVTPGTYGVTVVNESGCVGSTSVDIIETLNPLSQEIVYNGIDDDCDPSTLDDDLDQDGYILLNDCDDTNPEIHPGQEEEILNGIDDDCDPATADFDGVDCFGLDGCIPDANFEVVNRSMDPDGKYNLPKEGPFYPGEEITICVEYEFRYHSLEYLIGMIPYFGNGWDLTDFTPEELSPKTGIYSSEWYPQNSTRVNQSLQNLCTYTDEDGKLKLCNKLCMDCQECDGHLQGGDRMPGGWFWLGNSFVDDCEYDDNIISTSLGVPGHDVYLDFCITLKVSNEDNVQEKDMTFGFELFGDALIGCFFEAFNYACELNEPELVTYQIIDEVIDFDNDGFSTDLDCNDFDPAINPDILEIVYNGIDDDCDPSTLDDDLDQDGYDFVEDCDDNDPKLFPSGEEIPYNGIDDDCNLLTLDDDLDQDGYGLVDDCDDTNPNINPSQTEIPYNGINEDCDSLTYDNDLDQDGYIVGEDCDDLNFASSPGNIEIPYNGIDDDCNPSTPDDDVDGDGFPFAIDCDDEDATIGSGTVEVPYNGIDDDCDDTTPDDDLDGDGLVFEDDCNDMVVGTPTVSITGGGELYCGACSMEEQIVIVAFDGGLGPYSFFLQFEADGDSLREYKVVGKVEQEFIVRLCLNRGDFDHLLALDGNNGMTFRYSQDSTSTYGVTLHSPVDNGFYPDATLGDDSCVPEIIGEGKVSYTKHLSEEVPYNDINEDCDILTLDDDLDEDGFDLSEDCDDMDPLVFPGAECNDENECTINDILNEDCICLGEHLPNYGYYQDADADGFGSSVFFIVDCSETPPEGYTDNNHDCDDTNPNINPDAEDIPNNGIDEDCDGEDFLSSTYELNGQQIEIYPNPVSEILQVKGTTEKTYRLQLIDMNGRLITEKYEGSTLDCTHLLEGMYLLKVIDSQSGDFVVERVMVVH